jgi:hypothetical protein
MPIEKPPRNPNYVPPGGMPYKVKTGEDLRSIAKGHGLSEAELIKFNFGTTDRAEVNWFLRRNVGCNKPTHDGKNWVFTSDAKPGLIYIPVQSVPAINIHHRVTLFPQPTNMTCWSAAATMLFGSLESVGSGRATLQPSGGMDFNYANIQVFARGLGLLLHPPQSWTVQGIANLLQRGPIMITGRVLRDPRTGRPVPHAIVVGGMIGDGTPSGTSLTIYDPWPPGIPHGSRNVLYRDFMSDFPSGTTYILHR